jgi:hypothetical protein
MIKLIMRTMSVKLHTTPNKIIISVLNFLISLGKFCGFAFGSPIIDTDLK